MKDISKSAKRALLIFGMCVLTGAGLYPEFLQAGPAILCHPIDIGDAKSLPLGNGPFGYDRHYDRSNLLKDALQVLNVDMPILVRMETLRRATLYATRNLTDTRRSKPYTSEDRSVAFELLARLQSRIYAGDKAEDRALAVFDAGYLMQCYREAGLLQDNTGYDMVRQAIQLRGGDAEMQFACALMTKNRFFKSRRDQHLSKALVGVERGSLLAVNLAIHFKESSIRF